MGIESITTTEWLWAGGFGVLTLVMLFGAAEGLVKGKLNAPSIVFAGFLLALASISLSLFLACLGDFQMGSTDTLDDLHTAYKQVWWYFNYWS